MRRALTLAIFFALVLASCDAGGELDVLCPDAGPDAGGCIEGGAP